VHGNKRKRSEETREIADNSDDVVELEMSYELECLGAPYGRSDDIWIFVTISSVYMAWNTPSADPAVSQKPNERVVYDVRVVRLLRRDRSVRDSNCAQPTSSTMCPALS
jgi:hypothetical protein